MIGKQAVDLSRHKLNSRIGYAGVEKETRDGRIFAAVTEAEKARLLEIAASYRVDLPVLLRWFVTDAISGVWVPSHLKKAVE